VELADAASKIQEKGRANLIILKDIFLVFLTMESTCLRHALNAKAGQG
jgi:hypothetical protein